MSPYLEHLSRLDPHALLNMSISRKNNKFDVLEDCAEGALEKTGFFHSGPEAPRRCEREGYVSSYAVDAYVSRRLINAFALGSRRRAVPSVQKGVVRTNCIGAFYRDPPQFLRFVS